MTAHAIANQIGLSVEQTITGDKLENLDENELLAALRNDVLFARTKPADKMRVVAALQKMQQIVAMTGDGVNDAPALKQADIGISGVNFAIADTGTLCLVENEGNGRLSTTAPPVHIALMGIEKVIPSIKALPTLQKLLTRSALRAQTT